jgi:hypothetical protein
MPRKSTIDMLPVEVRLELKKRLRTNHLSQLGITRWLNELGYETTKSAINRYAIHLKAADKAIGVDREILAMGNADVVALFEELTILKARETEILTQIRLAMTQ